MRWLRDEMISFAEYNGESESLNLADRLNRLFSSDISFREIDQHIDESLILLRHSVKVEGLSGLDFSSKEPFIQRQKSRHGGPLLV